MAHLHSFIRPLFLPSFFVLAFSPVASASPIPVQVWEADLIAEASLAPGAGFVVDSIGDLDGDGHRDGLITSIQAASNRGRVWAVSSATGAVILSVGGARPEGLFGHSVAGLGDVNGDGLADFVVGAPATNVNLLGEASVHSGADGSLLWVASAEFGRDTFGWVVAGIGDIDGDGAEDVAVTAPGHDQPVLDAGKVYALSGATGAVLRTWNGSVQGGFFGASVGGTGDVNGDGIEDMVACTLFGGVNGRGAANVYSGADGSQIWDVSAGTVATQYGNYFSGEAGDVNADGVPDVYVIDYLSTGQRGRLFVYSGLDGSILHSLRGPQGSQFLFGRVKVGDLDRDGYDDLLLASGANNVGGSGAGAVYLYSGRTGLSLGRFTADTAAAGIGTDAVSVGDVDGDGAEDIFAGVGLGTATGGAYVLPGGPLPPYSYCNLVGGPAAPTLDYRGSTSLGSGTLEFTAAGLPAGTIGIAIAGPCSTTVSFGSGSLCVDGPFARTALFTASPSGSATFTPNFPANGPAAVVTGVQWHAQVWFRNPPSMPFPADLTNALQFVLRP